MRGDGVEFRSIINSDVENTGRGGLDPDGVSLGRIFGL